VSLARTVRDDGPVIRPLLDDRDLAALRTAWAVDADDAISALAAGCDGRTPASAQAP
jgi:hypothetical protein